MLVTRTLARFTPITMHSFMLRVTFVCFLRKLCPVWVCVRVHVHVVQDMSQLFVDLLHFVSIVLFLLFEQRVLALAQFDRGNSRFDSETSVVPGALSLFAISFKLLLMFVRTIKIAVCVAVAPFFYCLSCYRHGSMNVGLQGALEVSMENRIHELLELGKQDERTGKDEENRNENENDTNSKENKNEEVENASTAPLSSTNTPFETKRVLGEDTAQLILSSDQPNGSQLQTSTHETVV